ncbi:hypothetical protein Zmor_021491 [Zophobas morio]|uniref:Uncharacterized protein n=1 Tax=Zophobas morio TaxID=2755281 RepID=A0AA38I2W2_9CUCU|nr:hypothetical protein Zmor_021491 [Zophobas morio]
MIQAFLFKSHLHGTIQENIHPIHVYGVRREEIQSTLTPGISQEEIQSTLTPGIRQEEIHATVTQKESIRFPRPEFVGKKSSCRSRAPSHLSVHTVSETFSITRHQTAVNAFKEGSNVVTLETRLSDLSELFKKYNAIQSDIESLQFKELSDRDDFDEAAWDAGNDKERTGVENQYYEVVAKIKTFLLKTDTCTGPGGSTTSTGYYVFCKLSGCHVIVSVLCKMKRTKSLGWLHQCRDKVKNKNNHARNFGYTAEEKRPWSSAEQLNKKR